MVVDNCPMKDNLNAKRLDIFIILLCTNWVGLLQWVPYRLPHNEESEVQQSYGYRVFSYMQ